MDEYESGDWGVDPGTIDYGDIDMSGDGDNDWFWDAIDVDPNSVDYGGMTTEEVLAQIGAQDPSVASTLSKFLSTAGTNALGFLKSKFTDPATGNVNWKNAAALAGGLYSAYQASQADKAKLGYQGSIPKYTAVREAVQGTYDPERRAGSGGQRYFSDTKYVTAENEAAAREAAKAEAAGLAALNRDNPAREAKNPTTAAIAKADASQEVKKLAGGGITELAGGGSARYLSGATDGMADKIPARIDGGQEARLSHGEFVIPADVVGHLGNGNSEAGAQRLYDMMDRVRKARTGSTKQGRQINPNKFTPA